MPRPTEQHAVEQPFGLMRTSKIGLFFFFGFPEFFYLRFPKNEQNMLRLQGGAARDADDKFPRDHFFPDLPRRGLLSMLTCYLCKQALLFSVVKLK